MTDRLRKLDALFAEKVLGLTGPWCEGNCEAFYKPIRCEACDGRALPRYTRSLDAAWEGVVVVANPDKTPAFDVVIRMVDGLEAHVEFRSVCGRFGALGVSPHPAEALVLACLRAVGVEVE